jgi:hypothetical protein
MITTKAWSTVVIAGATAALLAAGVQSASATAGTETITAGTLALTAPTTAGFTATTLNGTAQAATATQLLDALDNRGSGAGWNITLTSTTWTSGGNTLSTTATTEPVAPVNACDVAGCTLANLNAVVTYPYTVPAAVSAPTATKIFSAALNTGLSGQTTTNLMSLAIPATALAGAYTSTWTYSIVTGP